MAMTADKMAAWCRGILGDDAKAPKLPLEKYLEAIPRLESLKSVPSGTPVLVRGDVDAKPGPKVGDGDIRLRSMKETLEFGRKRGWKQIIFGHIGREPEKSLSKVRARLAEILGCEVTFIEDWFDPATAAIKDEVPAAIRSSSPGSVLMLQNTRKYDIERVLWKAKPADCPKLADKLAKFANECAEKIAKVYVHEAFSAGSLDASSVVVPAAHGQGRPGIVRSRAVPRPALGLPRRGGGGLQRFEGRQVGRHGGNDQSGQDSPGDFRRLAGDGVEEGVRGA